MTAFTLRFRPLFALGLAAFTLGWSDEIAEERDPAAERTIAEALHEDRHPHVRVPLRGTSFPEGVLALTWDDGPDTNTLALAQYLHSRRLSGTFFVVREWERDVSEEPGIGRDGHDPFATGYAHLPILGEIVGLGHRLGNHTDEHVLLYDLSITRVIEQLGRAQTALDPFLSNELRLFRPPGGYWNDVASSALDGPAFASTVGPVRWDIDEKDWSASTHDIPAKTVAKSYVATIDRLKRGIVLMHDRVGAVGSHYALDLARALVPALEARGYVFASPVLAFSRFEPRFSLDDREHSPALAALAARSLRVADLDGDGRADLCGEHDGAIVCARSRSAARAIGALPRTSFSSLRHAAQTPAAAVGSALADIDGDGRADLCFLQDESIACARATTNGFAPPERWSTDLGAHGDAGAALRLADVDGDGRADACVRDGDAGLLCATSTGSAFANARTWIDGSTLDPARVELADVNGDGRADACSTGICAVSTGSAFGAPLRWSSAPELTQADEVRFGDLNGDGRADACMLTSEGIACAFSNGHAFTAPSLWLDRHVPSFELADINADGRADVCAIIDHSVSCGLAP